MKGSMVKSVYVMESGGAYKIGVSSEPKKRLNTLQLGNRNVSLIYTSSPMRNAYEVESIIHHRLKKYSIGREWFSHINRERLLNTVKRAVQKEGQFNEYHEINTQSEIKIIYGGNRITLSQYIDTLEKETEQIRLENDAIIDLFPLVCSNTGFAMIAGGLLGLGWSYLDTLNFLKSISPMRGNCLQHN